MSDKTALTLGDLYLMTLQKSFTVESDPYYLRDLNRDIHTIQAAPSYEELKKAISYGMRSESEGETE